MAIPPAEIVEDLDPVEETARRPPSARAAQPVSNSDELPIGPGAFPGFRHPLRSLLWLMQIAVGMTFLVGLLAVMAAVPGLSLLTLGYLLDAEARVGRSGRFRDGFPLLAVSARTGLVLLLVTLFLVPVQILAFQAAARGIIVNGSPLSSSWLMVAMRWLQAIVFVHLLLAIANGGSLSCFFRPVRNVKRLVSRIRSGRYVTAVNEWSQRLLDIFQPWTTIKIALRGAVGAFLWLAIPTALLAASTWPREDPGPAFIVTAIGALLLVPVAAWLPLLQAHQAVTGRFTAIFEVRTVRRLIGRVPVRWLVATTGLYTLALPLYFTKIRLPAQDAVWLVTPLFVLLTYPSRILIGWVYGAGMQKADDAFVGVRWTAKLVMIPLLLLYAGLLFVTPLISEVGRAAIFENHAFLLPVPTGRLFGG